jgi:CRISPR system Cascade subunit CasE
MALLYLSRLTLNPLRREVQRDLADCYAMHRRLLSAFPDEGGASNARDCFQVLYRVEIVREQPTVLVQSGVEPDWSHLPADYLWRDAEQKRIDAFYGQLRDGMVLRFRLAANPTRRISARNATETERWHGKRVGVRGEKEQLAWLQRKGEHGGFAVLSARTSPAVSDVRVAPGATITGVRKATGRISLEAVCFEGRLRVTESDRFRQIVAKGIGSGKAFGMGLLSVAVESFPE